MNPYFIEKSLFYKDQHLVNFPKRNKKKAEYTQPFQNIYKPLSFTDEVKKRNKITPEY